ncbi:DNA (cytosine-5-)-methyltransferase [Rothia kristinae]|uniref:Cytosine-specific methyltransferase n=1 Tax=Rothia kristinae TaxID=37923 RepID=A0A1S2N0I6_9MICC|nr:DNA cytosine methyltransferase [Rothia kristinae]OIJ36114.1 DNA (cytosine-5-)-methyltransferase [Rothia kristinae]
MAKTVRMGEFFSGPGGMAKGAEMAAADSELRGRIELRHAWAVDFDGDSCETYRENISIDSGDVHTMDARDAVERLDEFSAIDGFAFGFPCNDFSLVGRRLGLDGPYGPLFRSGIRVLEEKQPAWFVAENVSGLRSANGGRAFATILKAMAEAGYRIVPHLYRFEEYGVPQKRHRVIIVGTREDLDLRFHVPAPTHGEGALLKPFETVGKTFSRPMAPDVQNNEPTRQSKKVVERLRLIDAGENAFNAKRMTDAHRLNVRGATLSNIYRRLDPALPSYTITGSGGGGTHVYHWEQDRALTNRERARLQSFDDDFVFSGGRASVRRQIGMAVPPVGAKAIFGALFRTLCGIEYSAVPSNLIHLVDEEQLELHL